MAKSELSLISCPTGKVKLVNRGNTFSINKGMVLRVLE
jgi:hypothetical protein